MRFRIGFSEKPEEKNDITNPAAVPAETTVPRKSVVQVHFPDRGMTLAYYNDQFDLHRGDIVFVDGKLEGLRGRIMEVNYNFKIKLSDYKRVIAVADTNVRGSFYMAGSHFVTFDPAALPIHKVTTWYMAPLKEDDAYVNSSDDTSFCLEDPKGFQVSEAIAARGHTYYMENRVVYLCIDGTRGYAIVEGGSPYEIEFRYTNGEISGLVCTCFCSYHCKHEAAAILQLRETLHQIEAQYADAFRASDYFAAIAKSALFGIVIDGRETGQFTLS